MNRRLLVATALAALGGAYTLTLGAREAQPLPIDAARLAQLQALRMAPKFTDLPGAPAAEERGRLEPLINNLLDRLIAGLPAHPTDSWVLDQMEPAVGAFYLEDTEARARCLAYLEAIFKILGMPDDRGRFRKYLIFW